MRQNKKTISLYVGTKYMIVVQLFFLASGIAIHAVLGRLLGPAAYGVFGVVIYFSNLLTEFLRKGIPLAASKYMAENAGNAGAIKGKANTFQLIFISLTFSAVFFFPHLFADIVGDHSLTPYLRAASFIIPATGFFILYDQYLNGLRQYDKQAIVDIIYCVAKVMAVCSLVLLGFGIYGAILGFAAASLIGLGAAVYLLRVDSHGNFETKLLIKFAIPSIIYSLLFTFLLSADLFFIKAILNEGANVGYYTAASILSKIPFYILGGGLSTALLPAISNSISNGDTALTRKYINNAMRYLLIFLLPTIFLMKATAGTIIALFYSSEYTAAASPFGILVIGIGFITIFQVLIAIINASGKPHVSMAIVFLLVIVTVILNVKLIPGYFLKGAALSTTISAFIGLVAASLYVFIKFESLIEFKSFVRIAAASIIIFVAGHQINSRQIFAVPVLPFVHLLLFALYFGVLVLFREMGKKDFAALIRFDFIPWK